MMKQQLYPSKAYDSIEYGVLLPDTAVAVEGRRHQKKRMSCMKCVCITVLVLVSVVLAIGISMGLWGYFWTQKQVKRFTTDTPVHYEIHELPEEELDVVRDRAKLFYDSIRAGMTPAEDLVVTQDVMNAFIAHSDFLRGNAQVEFTANKMTVDMSLPVEGFPGGKGRYFVASGSLTMEANTNGDEHQDGKVITTDLETPYPVDGMDFAKLWYTKLLAYVASDGTKTLNIQEGHFYNWVVPYDYIAKKENLLDHVCDDKDDMDEQDCQDLMTVLDGIEDISIEDQKITFHARAASGRRLGAVNPASAVKSSGGKSYTGYARRALAKMVL